LAKRVISKTRSTQIVKISCFPRNSFGKCAEHHHISMNVPILRLHIRLKTWRKTCYVKVGSDQHHNPGLPFFDAEKLSFPIFFTFLAMLMLLKGLVNLCCQCICVYAVHSSESENFASKLPHANPQARSIKPIPISTVH
jgi:hypothetical protein